MLGLSKVIVLDPDARAGRQVQLGFEREGVPSTIAVVPAESSRLDLPTEGAGLVVVGGTDDRALDLLRRTRLNLDASKVDAPIVFAGRGVRRSDAEAAGADEVVLLPAYLRDVVTIGRLLRGQPAAKRDHIVGSLAETTGVYTLVRALSALGRSAVLTLMRGLRRGEIRFFHGEVTSAQVGLIHGQAALHQLLLWTEARFEFYHEDVVRRQQIPLSHDELFADAERFLEGVRDSSGKLSPSMVLEQDLPRVHGLGKQIPTEVHGVLRMFDGHRVLADVLEDSPYRVFETLRVAQRACDVGLLRVVEAQRPKATWRAVLSIEEWLVGSDRKGVVDRTSTTAESGPVTADRAIDDSGPPKLKGGKRKRRKRRANPPFAVVPALPTGAKADIDWGALVPRVVGAEIGPLSGVVPAAHASGEIEIPTREAPRERLEALMDTDKRTRIFPTDIGLEPKVVFDEEVEVAKANREHADAIDRARSEARARERMGKQNRDRDEVDAQAKADGARARSVAEAKAKAESVARVAADAKANADANATARAEAARVDAEAKAKAEAARVDAEAKAEAARVDAEAKAMAMAEAARVDAEAKAMAEAARVDAEAKAKAEAARVDAEVKAKAEAAAGAAMAKAEDAAWTAAAEARDDATADASAKAKPALPKGAFDVKAEADAQIKAEIAEQLRKKREEADAAAEDAKLRAEATEWARQQAAARVRAAEDVAREAEELTKRLAHAKAQAETESIAADQAMWRAAEEQARRVAAEEAATKADTDATTPFIREPIEIAMPAVTIAETPTTVRDTLTITGSAGTSVVTSKSTATISVVTPRSTATTVEAISDGPSDGVVQPMGTAETKLVPRRPPPGEVPLDDRPEAKTGEIPDVRARRATVEPALSEPSILVADLAAAHTAVSAVAIAQVAAPPTVDIASPSREIAVTEVRKDAVAFSEDEEAFFRAGTEKAPSKAVVTAPVETFDDLDEGYQPVGFWDRLRGKKRLGTSPPPTATIKKKR